MTGIELIAKERQEQLKKHGYTIEDDREYNNHFPEFPLTKVASALSIDDTGNSLATACMKPTNWSQQSWENMMSKPYKERLIIAGALIAAEIDRIS